MTKVTTVDKRLAQCAHSKLAFGVSSQSSTAFALPSGSYCHEFENRICVARALVASAGVLKLSRHRTNESRAKRSGQVVMVLQQAREGSTAWLLRLFACLQVNFQVEYLCCKPRHPMPLMDSRSFVAARCPWISPPARWCEDKAVSNADINSHGRDHTSGMACAKSCISKGS
jgi:hypothetical protein